MSKEYDNTNRGVMFENDRKESDRHPDWKGSLNVEGKEFWIDAWVKNGPKGTRWSLSIKPKEQRQPANSRGRSQQRQPSSDGFDDGEVPF